MIQVLITDPFRPDDMVRFDGIEGCRCVYSRFPTEEELSEAEVIMGRPPADCLKAAKKLRFLQSTYAGVDNYTCCPELFQNGLQLASLSGAFGQSISEFVLTMCLMMYKHMHLYRDNQNAHNWHDEGRQDSPVGKNLLILGAGDIGCKTAALFRPFGCRITGMRRTVREVPAGFDEMITMEQLEEALPAADIIVCALPESPQTHKLMNAERLALMKPTAVLINVGRGQLVDCEALAEVLNAGKLRGAALDVTDPEPLPREHPLWSCRNAIITPHITGGSFGHLTATEENLFSICTGNLKRYAAGEPLMNLVDLSSGYRQVNDRYR